MELGDRLKTLRKHYGYSQTDIAEKLNTSQHNVSYYESNIELTGLLDYIYKFCLYFRIPVYEFFMTEPEDYKRVLPDYITPTDAAVLRILNTSIDIKARLEIKEAFMHIMKAVLVNYADKLGHMPEYQALFEEGPAPKVAEDSDKYKGKK